MIGIELFLAVSGALAGFCLFLLRLVFGLSTRMTRAETQIEFKNTKLDALASKVDDLTQSINSLNVNIADLRARIKV